MFLVIRVPEYTIPYECGERFMACTFRIVKEKTETENGKLELEKCNKFFKTEEETRQFIKENSEYILHVKEE